jgi:hypothetical protein
METVLFNFIILFFALSGFLAWSAVLFLIILYSALHKDIKRGFDKHFWE